MKQRKKTAVLLSALLAASVLSVASAIPSQAASLTLGDASDFSVLTGTGLTNTGATTIQGDIGMYPTISYSDSGSIALTGGYHFGDKAAVAGINAATSLYAAALASTPATPVVGDLGGQTLAAGTYVSPTGLNLNGTLTLDGKGDQNSVFVLQTPTTLSTGAASHINLVNGVQACNVFWQVGTSSVLGSSSDFKGNLLSNSNISLGSAATVVGRLISLHGSAALNGNSITKPTCVTFTKAATVISAITPAAGTYLPGTTFTLSSKVAPKTGTAVCTGAVTYSLDKNPLTGVSGSYALTSPVVSTNWMVGSYHLIATYPGDVNCAASSAYVELKIGNSTQSSIQDNGAYNTPTGVASYALNIKSVIQAGSTTPVVNGKIVWSIKKQWMFQGSISTLALTNNVYNASGTGTLWYWTSKERGNHWVKATNGNALVNIQFTTTAPQGTVQIKNLTTFGIGFVGSPVVPTLKLPVLGALSPVLAGNDGKDD